MEQTKPFQDNCTGNASSGRWNSSARPLASEEVTRRHWQLTHGSECDIDQNSFTKLLGLEVPPKKPKRTMSYNEFDRFSTHGSDSGCDDTSRKPVASHQFQHDVEHEFCTRHASM